MELYDTLQSRRFRKMGSGSEPYNPVQRTHSEADNALSVDQGRSLGRRQSENGTTALVHGISKSQDIMRSQPNIRRTYTLDSAYNKSEMRRSGSVTQLNGKKDQLVESFQRAHDSGVESPHKAQLNGLNGKSTKSSKSSRLHGILSSPDEFHSRSKSSHSGAAQQMLRDMHDQTKMLRAQIGNLSQQNQELRQKYSQADMALSEAENSRTTLQIDFHEIQKNLQRAEAELRLTKNREQQMKQLQKNLKQLTEEKEKRMSNEAVSSRASLEKLAFLNRRIEELEAELSASKLQTKGSQISLNGMAAENEAQLQSLQALEAELQRVEKDKVQESESLQRQVRDLHRKCKEQEAAHVESGVKARRLGEANKDLSRQCKQGLEATELLAAMNHQNNTLQAENEALTAANAELSAGLQQYREEAQKTSQTFNGLEHEHGALQEAYDKTVTELKRSSSRQREIGAQYGAEKESLYKALATTERQLREAEEKVQGAGQELDSLHKQLVDSEHQREVVEDQLHQLQEETKFAIQALELRVQAQAEELKHTQNELADEQGQIRELKGEAAQLAEGLRESDNVRRASQGACQHLEAERASLEASLRDMAAELQAVIDSESQLRSALGKVEEENQEVVDQLNAAVKESALLKASIYDAQKHTESLSAGLLEHSQISESLAAQLAEQTRAREEVEGKLVVTQKELKELQDGHEGRLQGLHATLEQHKVLLGASNAKCTNLESAVQAMHKENKDADNAKKNLQAINVSARRDLEESHRQIQALQEHNQQLKELSTVARQDHEEAELEIAKLHSDLQEEQAITRSVLKDSQERGLRGDRLERDLEAATADLQGYKDRTSDLSRENELSLQHITSLTEKLEEAAEEIEQLKSALASSKSANESQKAQIASLGQRLRDVEKELQRAALEKMSANSESTQLKQRITDLQSDVLRAEDRVEAEAQIARSHLEAALQQQAESLGTGFEASHKELTQQMTADFQKEKTALLTQAAEEQVAVLSQQERSLREAASKNLEAALEKQRSQESSSHQSALAAALDKQRAEILAEHESALAARLEGQKKELEALLDEEVDAKLREQETLLLSRHLIDRQNAVKRKESELQASHQRTLQSRLDQLEAESLERSSRDLKAALQKQQEAHQNTSAESLSTKLEEQERRLNDSAQRTLQAALQRQAAQLEGEAAEKLQTQAAKEEELRKIAEQEASQAAEQMQLALAKQREELNHAALERTSAALAQQASEFKLRLQEHSPHPSRDLLAKHMAEADAASQKAQLLEQELLQERQAHTAKVAELEELLATKTDEGQQVADGKEAMRKLDRRCSELEGQKESLTGLLEQSKGENEELSARVRDLQRHSETMSLDYEKARSELQTIQQNQDTRAEQESSQSSQIQDMEKGKWELERRVEELSQEKQALANEVSAAGNQVVQAQEAAQKLAKELLDATSQHDDANTKGEDSRRELAAQRIRCIELQGSLESKVKDNSALAESHQAAQEECLRLSEEARMNASEIQAMHSKLRAMNTQLTQALKQLEYSRQDQELSRKEVEAQAEASRQLEDSLSAAQQSHNLAILDMSDVIRDLREAPDRDNAALNFELQRLIQENDMLRAKNDDYEEDVQKLLSTRALGHSNPKQKLQYHLRWKQELEHLKHECTLLLRERFQLEQCVRYLAVRCGLSTVEKDVTNSRERSPVEHLQPASLVSHYKFVGQSPHLSEAAPDHIEIEDLFGESDPEEETQSVVESLSTVTGSKPDKAVEQQILARVAFIVNPASGRGYPTRSNLTQGALLALPSSKGRDNWGASSARSQGSNSVVSDFRPAFSERTHTVQTAHSDSFSEVDDQSVVSLGVKGSDGLYLATHDSAQNRFQSHPLTRPVAVSRLMATGEILPPPEVIEQEQESDTAVPSKSPGKEKQNVGLKKQGSGFKNLWTRPFKGRK